MRDTFVKTFYNHAVKNKKVTLVTGDLGFGVFTDFEKNLPNQYINAGIAEQNMTGLSAGLAFEGRIVFTYSIANFPTLRCLEQIRNDIIYHQLPVTVVAIGGGLSYGALGISHHAIEDVAVMRALSNIRVFSPCDDTETAALVTQSIEDPFPTYLRLDKSKARAISAEPFIIGKLRKLRHGPDAVIIGYGGILEEALAAADILARDNINCSIYSAHTIKPFDVQGFINIIKEFELVVILEEHLPIGGLGSLACEIIVQAGLSPKKLLRMCLADGLSSIVGSQHYLRMRHGLDFQHIVSKIQDLSRR